MAQHVCQMTQALNMQITIHDSVLLETMAILNRKCFALITITKIKVRKCRNKTEIIVKSKPKA